MAERTVTFTADGLRLEGRLYLPNGATRGAVICHPHPQYGGTLDNNVVAAVATALRGAGVATLRFNFRGVGSSEGRYGGGAAEVHDVRAAVAYLRGAGAGDVTLAGYSFGAAVAARALHEDAALAARLVLVAPPLALFPLDFLASCALPKLIVAGEHDEYCPLASLQRVFASFPEPKTSLTVPGTDHFFFGAEAPVAAAVVRFATEAPSTDPSPPPERST